MNLVPTLESGAWFDAAVDHRAVRMVSFTGSTEVGRLLLARSADRILKAVMELGGNGFDEGVTCGPMIDAGAVATIDSLVSEAKAAGAGAVLDGGPMDRPGFFYAPTVLGDVDPESPITRHEIFGPVAPVITFDDTDTMIDQANEPEMGLSAYVYTADIGRGLAVSERLQSGMVGLNRGAVSDPAAPFGGMKQSGLGREGASEGIYEFTETQYIATEW